LKTSGRHGRVKPPVDFVFIGETQKQNKQPKRRKLDESKASQPANIEINMDIILASSPMSGGV